MQFMIHKKPSPIDAIGGANVARCLRARDRRTLALAMGLHSNKHKADDFLLKGTLERTFRHKAVPKSFSFTYLLLDSGNGLMCANVESISIDIISGHEKETMVLGTTPKDVEKSILWAAHSASMPEFSKLMSRIEKLMPSNPQFATQLLVSIALGNFCEDKISCAIRALANCNKLAKLRAELGQKIAKNDIGSKSANLIMASINALG